MCVDLSLSLRWLTRLLKSPPEALLCDRNVIQPLCVWNWKAKQNRDFPTISLLVHPGSRPGCLFVCFLLLLFCFLLLFLFLFLLLVAVVLRLFVCFVFVCLSLLFCLSFVLFCFCCCLHFLLVWLGVKHQVIYLLLSCTTWNRLTVAAITVVSDQTTVIDRIRRIANGESSPSRL